MLRVLMLVMGLIAGFQSWATINAYPFEDAAKQTLFNELINEIRCPKCQNQTISDSDAPLAKDLKDKTYEMVQSGASKQEVIDYMISRYGFFVHYQPPVQSSTWVLWFGPFVFLMIAVVGVGWAVRKKRSQSPSELSAEEQARLAQLMDKDDSSS